MKEKGLRSVSVHIQGGPVKNFRALVLLLAMTFVAPYAAISATSQQEEPSPPALKEWTFLVFLNGHNDLDSYGTMNMNQMEQVGSNDKINLVVQWATMRAPTTKRYLVQKDEDQTRVTSPAVHDPGLIDMGKPESLVEFVRWAKENYPAKRYFINVWNHGAGWQKNRLAKALTPKDISYDDRFGSHITTEQLGVAMGEIQQILGQKVDIYGSDACLMAMAEVAGEMSQAVHVFLGSQEVEPGEGWPYAEFLRKLEANPEAEAPAVAAMLTSTFLEAYSDGIYGTRDVTLSAIDMNQWADFLTSMQAFSTAMMAIPDSDLPKVLLAARSTESYYEPSYRDLVHFTERLETSGVSNMSQESLMALRQSLQNLVVTNEVSEEYANSHGLSFWLPASAWSYRSHAERYGQLAFAQATGWDRVLARLFGSAANEEVSSADQAR